VVIYPTPVQGDGAAAKILQAIATASARCEQDQCDVLIVCRGGGSIEDLWSFNEEIVARAIHACAIPVISGVGHETDFTIADFCADVRAPTPTAAAELCAEPQRVWLGALDLVFSRLQDAVDRQMQSHSQRLDRAETRVSRPSHLVTRQQARLGGLAQSLRHFARASLRSESLRTQTLETLLPRALERSLTTARQRTERAQLRLQLLDPQLVLERGYAWLADMHGVPISTVQGTHPGQALRATLADGEVDLTVSAPRLI